MATGKVQPLATLCLSERHLRCLSSLHIYPQCKYRNTESLITLPLPTNKTQGEFFYGPSLSPATGCGERAAFERTTDIIKHNEENMMKHHLRSPCLLNPAITMLMRGFFYLFFYCSDAGLSRLLGL